MNEHDTPSWTLGELVVEVRQTLAEIGLAVADDRVSDAPDARAIRYYQGLGLVEKPARYDGRRAIYGRRHLVQAVAVKLLQSQGYGLSQIQEAFAAQPFDAIEAGVLRALGRPVAPAPEGPVQLRTYELAPGVLLTLDPRVVDQPDTLAHTVHQLVRGVLP
ncbi:MAG: MerR family transcriptional regulator [Myxococcales bacterium]|nr:MerR family transcriptional regulator [Myxococcales bacterium]MCB9691017.1 MerR family transcriptional regulator [Alphaproteobacteria bacterium]